MCVFMYACLVVCSLSTLWRAFCTCYIVCFARCACVFAAASSFKRALGFRTHLVLQLLIDNPCGVELLRIFYLPVP